MPSRPQAQRRVEASDVLFALFLAAYGALSIARIPADFTDLCYLFSLEQGRWVTQEWVHPIYVPALDLFRRTLSLLGYHGPMLEPVEMLNVAASLTALALLYRLARRFPGSGLAAAVALGVAALGAGFWSATVRPTPYALAFLCQTLSLSSLIADQPVPPRRYAIAGAFAGLSMGLHASAMALALVGAVCALFEPDPARTRRATLARVLAFGGGMLLIAVACWIVFFRYREIGASYFRRQDFWSTFTGIEQVRGTSIYTSGSATAQLSSYIETLRKQGGDLLSMAAILAVPAVLLRLWKHAPVLPSERRLAIAAAANFAAIAGFFLINNTHNGFIFASLTLVPVLLAVAIRGSWIATTALVLLAVARTPDVVNIVRASAGGANDPLLAEVRFLHELLGPRDVLLTPGSPFPELLYLSHLNVIEVSETGSTLPGPEVPVVHPGPALRARIAWWLDHGARVFYALGDDATDFKDDIGGAEKERQIFWRPETEAHERAPNLRALRTALEASGLDMRDGPRSPRGQRYAAIIPRDALVAVPPGPAAAPLTPGQLHALFVNDGGDARAAWRARKTQFLIEFAAAIPGDPWLACDTMDLICQEQPCRNGTLVPCRQIEGCDHHDGARADGDDTAVQSCRQPRDRDDGTRATCFWGPVSDQKVIGDYLDGWVRKQRLGQLSNWGLTVDGESTEMTLVLSEGTLAMTWHLLDSCEPGPIDAKPSDGISPELISADRLHELAVGLPVPKVRPVSGRN